VCRQCWGDLWTATAIWRRPMSSLRLVEERRRRKAWNNSIMYCDRDISLDGTPG
jgi:hypothetical protein